MKAHIINKNNSEREYPVFKINNTSNALECGLFSNPLLISQGCVSFHIDRMNNPILLVSMPNIENKEVAAFMEKPLNFYVFPIANNEASAFILSGAIEIDVTFENIYNATGVNAVCDCFLIDSVTYQIRGFRTVALGDNLRRNIYRELKKADKCTLNKYQIIDAYTYEVEPYTHAQLIKKSKYIGSAVGGLKTQNLFTL